MLLAINVAGWAVGRAYNSVHGLPIWGGGASSDVNETIFFPLNPSHGNYYRCELSSLDGQSFNVLFTTYASMMSARNHGTPIEYDADRSAFDVTSVTLEGQLPDGDTVYELVVVSAEPGAEVAMDTSGSQASFPLGLGPVLQAATFICYISSMFLFFLLVYAYDRYRKEAR